MVQKIDWESQIGRRLKLRDLHVFSTVVQRGSMAKAAQHLRVSQPAVSEVVANLEHALGVRLLDRSAQGIEPTIYGDALLKRSVAAFDELKQSIRDIEFLSDATKGEVRIGCIESLWYTLLPEVILRFSKQYPRVEVHADLIANSRDFHFPRLRDRQYDFLLHRTPAPFPGEYAPLELSVEHLSDDDTVVVAAGAHTKWARRRKIELAELVDVPWTFGASDTWNHVSAEQVFRARGLSLPRPSVTAVSITLRARLIAGGAYLGTFLSSVVRQLIVDHYAIKALPVDLPATTHFSASIVTLRKRTLSPVVERFIACLREVAKSRASKPVGRAARSSKPNVHGGNGPNRESLKPSNSGPL